MKRYCLAKNATSLLIAAVACQMAVPASYAEQTFKLNATQTDTLKDTGTSLSRQDIKKKNQPEDPFSNEGPEDALDAPQAAFQAEKPIVPPKPPAKPFNLRADQATSYPMPFNGMPAQGRMAPGPVMDMNTVPDAPVQQPPPPPQYLPTDPDATQDMMLAWDLWHKRVAATIYDRFNFFAKAAFRHSPPLRAMLSYQVTRDGHIINMNMQEKSSNVLFNVLVYQCVKSLDGDMSVLAFPQGSQRTVVAKAGVFTQNYGQEGFRYITGDKERIPGHQ